MVVIDVPTHTTQPQPRLQTAASWQGHERRTRRVCLAVADAGAIWIFAGGRVKQEIESDSAVPLHALRLVPSLVNSLFTASDTHRDKVEPSSQDTTTTAAAASACWYLW